MTERTRVFVATPCFGGDLKMAYVLSALKLQAAATARGIDIQFNLIGNESLIVRARNELAHQFLMSGASHRVVTERSKLAMPDRIPFQ